ncbi:MAG: germination protein YpeB [Ruminococcus callidus]|nr:germination protein YpeB [Ruminococcus callidus]
MQKNKIWAVTTVIALIVIAVLGYNLFNQKTAYATTKENDYNMAFYQVVENVQNVKTYLAKAMISKSAEHGAEMLTHVWREANLAQAYLGMLPIESQELENTEKYLNQVSEYSYSLSRKNIDGEGLTDDDMNKIKELYNYSNDLANTLNQMADELNNGTLKWSDLMKNTEGSEIAEVSTFDVVEENFHEYSGLIYDGAFSEHITSSEKKGLTGDEIDEETAKQKAEKFIGKDKIKSTQNNGFVENGSIQVYRFEMTTNDDKTIGISISKKGGHIVFMNYNRDVNEEKISEQEAVQKGKEYLASKGFNNMQETYYMKENGFITVNYAYKQGDVLMYADLIKVKIALDDGEVIGLETTGYLNCHYERSIPSNKISIEEARKNLSDKAQITSQGLAMIPTEWKTEKYCYEFKGKIEDIDFIAYINAETGEEEDILIVTNTPNGTFTE